MSGPKIIELDIWGRHEKEVLIILTEALSMLCKSSEELPNNEIIINWELCQNMRHINKQRIREGNGIHNTLSPEMKNPPSYCDGPTSPRSSKIPDIQWGFMDEQAMDLENLERFYCIECKRLGKGLGELYVSDGILRFVVKGHGYGKGEYSGAMVGYIQNMEMDEILGQINNEVVKIPLEVIFLFSGRWCYKGVTRLEQKLDRPEVPLTPFYLRHLWADLRCDLFQF